MDMLEGLAGSSGKYAKREIAPPVPPLGQRIAVAVDAAFGFTYPHVLDGWRKGGAEIIPFSPLADEAPNPTADAIYLPGGYPELYAGTIAARATVLDGLRMAATAGKTIFGECGGYMVLGRALTDADGTTHVMAGLLPVETSFAKRALQLGYREATVVSPCVLGPAGTVFRGHEFHYATMIAEDTDGRLFTLVDAFGDIQPSAGHICGSIAGSFIHLIDSLRANPAVLSIR